MASTTEGPTSTSEFPSSTSAFEPMRSVGDVPSRQYALSDAMFSVTSITDVVGVVQQRYDYTAFGLTTVLTPDFSAWSDVDPFGWQNLFHGETADQMTGWYNYGYRYYLPQLGAWSARDKIGEAGGINLYAFVYNNSIIKYDYLGNSAWDCFMCYGYIIAAQTALVAATLALAGALTCVGSIQITFGSDIVIALPCALVLGTGALAGAWGAINAYLDAMPYCDACCGKSSALDKLQKEVEALKKKVEEQAKALQDLMDKERKELPPLPQIPSQNPQPASPSK